MSLSACFLLSKGGDNNGYDQTKLVVAHSTTGISGYDPVAYFTEGKPTRGNGHHVVEFDGVTYLFASEDNKKKFEANPEKYIPAYGGYCALWRYEEKNSLAIRKRGKSSMGNSI